MVEIVSSLLISDLEYLFQLFNFIINLAPPKELCVRYLFLLSHLPLAFGLQF